MDHWMFWVRMILSSALCILIFSSVYTRYKGTLEKKMPNSTLYSFLGIVLVTLLALSFIVCLLSMFAFIWTA